MKIDPLMFNCPSRVCPIGFSRLCFLGFCSFQAPFIDCGALLNSFQFELAKVLGEILAL